MMKPRDDLAAYDEWKKRATRPRYPSVLVTFLILAVLVAVGGAILGWVL